MGTHVQMDADRDGEPTRVSPELDVESGMMTWTISATKKHRKPVTVTFSLNDLHAVLSAVQTSNDEAKGVDSWQALGDVPIPVAAAELTEPAELSEADLRQIEGVGGVADDFVPKG